MRRSDAGAGYGKAIVVLLFLGVVAYVGIKFIPVYVANYEMENYIHDLAIQMSARPTTAEAIQDNVVSKAQDLGLPITKEDVKVRITTRVTIDLDYQVPIDLKVYTWVLHFAPSSENVL